jgi:surfactin synthase thioesterase subunit
MKNGWIVFPRRRHPDVRLRLFCFPYGGGTASVFRAWPDRFPPDVEVCPVQLPGRESRFAEPAFTHVTPLVEELAGIIRPHLDRPYVLLGHSMGALIAFELARELRRRGEPAPAGMIVSGRRAPQLPQADAFHSLEGEEFIAAVAGLGGTPADYLRDPKLRDYFIPLLKADFSITETYVYGDETAPLDCPIDALCGTADARVSGDEMDAWRAQTAARFSLTMLPGDHFFINAPHSGYVDAVLRCVERLRAAVTPT